MGRALLDARSGSRPSCGRLEGDGCPVVLERAQNGTQNLLALRSQLNAHNKAPQRYSLLDSMVTA